MNQTTSSTLSRREVSIWANLALTVLLYGVFFTATATGAVRGGDQIGLLIAIVVAQVVALIAFEILLAIRAGADRPDERDAAIDLRSYRYAYWVLAFGIAWITIVYVAWAGVATVPDAAAAGLKPPSVPLVGNAVLLCFVAAEIVKGATQLILYRRGGL